VIHFEGNFLYDEVHSGAIILEDENEAESITEFCELREMEDEGRDIECAECHVCEAPGCLVSEVLKHGGEGLAGALGRFEGVQAEDCGRGGGPHLEELGGGGCQPWKILGVGLLAEG
jgi:hypothetical protein